jgi:hypothetical protein
MAISIPRSLVEFILLGPEGDRRQLQDSPILGDVWVEFAKRPDKPLELLITPYKDRAAGKVARALADVDEWKDVDAGIAFLQGIVAARLTFEQVLRFVIPMTHWWTDRSSNDDILGYASNTAESGPEIERILASAKAWQDPDAPPSASGSRMQDVRARDRYLALTGLILWAGKQNVEDWKKKSTEQQIAYILGAVNKDEIGVQLRSVYDKFPPRDEAKENLVWTISLNRAASPALTMSVPAVKADAARTLFSVNCTGLAWAVLDSGVDATHAAFQRTDGSTRVERSFDFSRIRDIVSLDNRFKTDKRKDRADRLLARHLTNPPADVEQKLQELAEAARDGCSINWELVEPLVEIDGKKTPPASNHGTHVAGIIGASKDAFKAAFPKNADAADGMCPDIRIYDFRVLASDLQQTEFAIIAALQYIRYINERNSYMSIHGANLSLSIPHDVRNYACGRTPVCNECERLVNSGVVVVAAAGNRGYQNFETKDGLYEGYAAFSVTDPGNADGVITVGATHRYWPHTYGVSFFSSRGPTGDGRLKPDLVAPGERIRAPLPKDEWGDLDGTSMAAPHVSGAAAMLMARYSELVGQPRRIKQILRDSATDLARERSFQGCGMLDVLRAFQSV